MLTNQEAWAVALALPAALEGERRCKASRLYYAAFHHANRTAAPGQKERGHKRFWGSLNNSAKSVDRLLSVKGRTLYNVREKADYKVDEDFSAIDMNDAIVLAQSIKALLEKTP